MVTFNYLIQDIHVRTSKAKSEYRNNGNINILITSTTPSIYIPGKQPNTFRAVYWAFFITNSGKELQWIHFRGSATELTMVRQNITAWGSHTRPGTACPLDPVLVVI